MNNPEMILREVMQHVYCGEDVPAYEKLEQLEKKLEELLKENKQMKQILSKETFNFCVNQDDFKDRLKYLTKSMQMYRGTKRW